MIWPDPDHDDLSAARGIMLGLLLGLLFWLLIFTLASCATPPPITVCPPVTAISPETQRQAADELMAPPPKPALSRIVSDWIQTRDRLRLCAP